MKEDRDQYLGEFSSRFRDLVKGRWKSWREASEALGVPESTLSHLGRGQGEPSAGLLLALSEKLNVSMSYLLGLEDEPLPPTKIGERRKAEIDFARVPHLDARAAAGAGSVAHIVAVDRVLPFPLWMLHKLAPHGAKVSFMRASGDSMVPTFGDGALLLVNESDTALPAKRPKHDIRDIFVFLQGDELRVKRLRRKETGEVIVLSDNRAYDPEILRGADLKRLKIIGRVIWWDERL